MVKVVQKSPPGRLKQPERGPLALRRPGTQVCPLRYLLCFPLRPPATIGDAPVLAELVSYAGLDQADVQSSGTLLVHAAYPADRRYVLTGQFGCHLVSYDQDLWFTDCDAHPASSGGPVFVQRKEGLKLAAIMVGILGDSRSVAVPIANWIDVLAARNCP